MIKITFYNQEISGLNHSSKKTFCNLMVSDYTAICHDRAASQLTIRYRRPLSPDMFNCACAWNLECSQLPAVCHPVCMVQVPSGSRPSVSDGWWAVAGTVRAHKIAVAVRGCTLRLHQGPLQHPALCQCWELREWLAATADITGLSVSSATLSSSLMLAA